MKKKPIGLVALCLLFALLFALPSSAFVRISYGLDRLSSRATLIKTVKRGESVSFSQDDFKNALGISRLRAITLLTLPDSTSGVLLVNGEAGKAGQTVGEELLSSLSFVPCEDCPDTVSFSFGNGEAGAALICRIRFEDGDNTPPAASTAKRRGASLVSYVGLSLFGQMTGEDADGDALAYLVDAYPKKGVLTEIDEESGAYCYIPFAAGEDSFSYVVRDEWGNYSSPMTVSLSVEGADEKRLRAGALRDDGAIKKAGKRLLFFFQRVDSSLTRSFANASFWSG